MRPSFISLCAMLDHLCRENGIEPPEMTLTFRDKMERERFKRALEKEIAGISAFPTAETRIDTCHGIKFLLGAKS